jgi:hypothetical protein
LCPQISVNERGWISSQDDTGSRENDGKEEAAIRNKISAFLRDFGRIAASSFPLPLKKLVILKLIHPGFTSKALDMWWMS